MLENSRHLETFHLRFPSAWWTIAFVFFYYDFLMLDLTLLLMCQKKIVIFILEDINFEIITRKRGSAALRETDIGTVLQLRCGWRNWGYKCPPPPSWMGLFWDFSISGSYDWWREDGLYDPLKGWSQNLAYHFAQLKLANRICHGTSCSFLLNKDKLQLQSVLWNREKSHLRVSIYLFIFSKKHAYSYAFVNFEAWKRVDIAESHCFFHVSKRFKFCFITKVHVYFCIDLNKLKYIMS
jgi:hypothetical protein